MLHGGRIDVGRYVQFGPRIGVYAKNHRTDLITPYNNPALFAGRLKEFDDDRPIKIGHSVWIGFGALILPGVTIGNGAVIGGHAVVSQDIPAYSIAVGTPAKPIKQRFGDEVAEALEAAAWWELSPKELEPYEALFTISAAQDPASLVEGLKRMAAARNR